MTFRHLKALSDKLKPQLIQWRRDFHQHPETAFEEFRTASIVAEHLKNLGLEVATNIGKTGVVGLLRGQHPGPTIALRADMDALPIQDAKTTDYRSAVDGKAHLCGHDAHTSILMGTAQLLTELGAPEHGNIKFIFQPAEEGYAGAKAMMSDGVLEHPEVDAIAGLHVFPGLPVGEIGVASGVAYASVDSIDITVIGKGGHAARPHEGIDSIAISAQLITALQNITSRMIDPLDSAVITIGKIEGGYMGAAIAPEVRMLGTVRTLSAELREQMPMLVEQVVRGITQSFGADYKLIYDKSYPVVRNDEHMINHVIESSELLFGKKRWSPVKPSTGGEDFAFYSEVIPGAFFRLGTGSDQVSTRYPLHSPNFDLDENALPIGSALLTAIALHYLSQSQRKKQN